MDAVSWITALKSVQIRPRRRQTPAIWSATSSDQHRDTPLSRGGKDIVVATFLRSLQIAQ